MFKKSLTTKYIYVYILLALCVAILSCTLSFGISGNDFWWHITAGEWIVDNMSVPKYDIFSWNAMSQNLKWTAHEWLSEVIYYIIFSFGGELGIYFFCLCAGIILIFLLYSVCKKDILKNIIFSILVFIFTTILFSFYFYGRPHLFSYFLLFAELKLLYDYVNGKCKKSIYLIPVIAIVWANIHGGSSNLTYILCIFFIITGVFNFTFGKLEFSCISKDKLITLVTVTLLSIAGLCLNPYGIYMLKYPYSNMGDTLMLDMILEWHAPDAKNISTLIFYYFPFAIGLISLLTTEQKIKARDLIIFAFFSYMFFRSSRFIVFLVISLPFYIFSYIPKLDVLPKIKSKIAGIISFCLLIIMFCITAASFVNCGFTYKKNELITHDLDMDFIELIKEEAPKRPYTHYDFGGDLIYYGVEVFVDGRADVYTGTPLADYYNLSNLVRHSTLKSDYKDFGFVEQLINKYDFDAFLIYNNTPLVQYLNSHPEKYKALKRKSGIVYYKVIQ